MHAGEGGMFEHPKRWRWASVSLHDLTTPPRCLYLPLSCPRNHPHPSALANPLSPTPSSPVLTMMVIAVSILALLTVIGTVLLEVALRARAADSTVAPWPNR